MIREILWGGKRLGKFPDVFMSTAGIEIYGAWGVWLYDIQGAITWGGLCTKDKIG